MTAAELRQSLDVLGWSQAELARRLKLHQNTVSKWMTGRAKVPGPVAAYVVIRLKLKEIAE